MRIMILSLILTFTSIAFSQANYCTSKASPTGEKTSFIFDQSMSLRAVCVLPAGQKNIDKQTDCAGLLMMTTYSGQSDLNGKKTKVTTYSDLNNFTITLQQTSKEITISVSNMKSIPSISNKTQVI
ncbi:MAG: hypothetical protein KDD45_09585, partial [Bdellovibrionales bacterium]|nr:hypothetical protein [Bdellovibrionales bacterium]